MDHLDGSMPGKGEAERCPLTFADVPEGHGAGDGQGRRGARGVGHGQRLVAGQQHLGVGGLHPVRVKPVVTQTQPAARHAVGLPQASSAGTTRPAFCRMNWARHKKPHHQDWQHGAGWEKLMTVDQK